MLTKWSQRVMRRAPDFVIGPPATPYLRRWWVLPRNKLFNIYLHEILRSDDDRALHDHPWINCSYIISGSYFEHEKGKVTWRFDGDLIFRWAKTAHRLQLMSRQRCVSLFITGPRIREWFFHCPQGLKPWREFVSPTNSGVAGPGCD